MAAAGIRNILIANQIVGSRKMDRLAGLIAIADPILVIDSLNNAQELAGAARRGGKRLRVLIEVDVGMHRAGVLPGAPVLTLARAVSELSELSFKGVFAWEGHTARIADPKEKKRAVNEALSLLTDSAEACRREGLEAEIVSCGGTGTYPTCLQHLGVTEVQVGGGIFSDMHYRTNVGVQFPCALSIIATVTSRPTPTRIVLDAGKKAMSSDAALPHPIGIRGVKSMRLSAEHAIIELEQSNDRPSIGKHVEFIVGYSDTTVHLHEEMIAIRNGRVEAVWRVAARGTR